VIVMSRSATQQGPDLKMTGKTATVSGTFNLACSANSANVCK
jgi:hypothetical protein